MLAARQGVRFWTCGRPPRIATLCWRAISRCLLTRSWCFDSRDRYVIAVFCWQTSSRCAQATLVEHGRDSVVVTVFCPGLTSLVRRTAPRVGAFGPNPNSLHRHDQHCFASRGTTAMNSDGACLLSQPTLRSLSPRLNRAAVSFLGALTWKSRPSSM